MPRPTTRRAAIADLTRAAAGAAADAECLAAVERRLAIAGCVAAAEEAARFVAAATDTATLESWLRRREQGEPVEWITGSVVFAGRRLHLTPGVYVPRPQSEELARRAVARLPPHGRALDLCTGAGAIAAHLLAAVPTATVVGIDIDPLAAACARRNGVRVIVADGAALLRAHPRVHVVTAVAPYVPTEGIRLLPADVQRHEPRRALDGGADGLTVVRRVIGEAARLLRPHGWVLVEVGGDQAGALEPTWRHHGFDSVTPWWDDDGDLRGVMARRSR